MVQSFFFFIFFAENSQILLKISTIQIFLKFMFSKKAIKKLPKLHHRFDIYLVRVKSTVKILSLFVAFSGNMNINFHLSGSTESFDKQQTQLIIAAYNCHIGSMPKSWRQDVFEKDVGFAALLSLHCKPEMQILRQHKVL